MTIKKIINLSVAIIAGLVIFSSCSKERIEAKKKNAYNSPDAYMDSKKEQEQEFIINSDSGDAIVGKLGTKIAGSRQCLQKQNADSVTLPYTIKLVELYTPKQMIYYRMPTVAGGTILRTDGEIRLRAFKGTEELKLKPDPCLAGIEMPNANPQSGMKVQYGFETSGHPDWTDNPASLGTTTTLPADFTTTTYGYAAAIARLGWINCGKKAGSGSNSKLTFVSDTDELTNVAIFVYFPTTKTVMQVYDLTTTDIPNGSAVKIIAIAVDASNKLFSFTQNTTVSSNTNIEVTMVETTDATLTSVLDAL